MEAVYTAYYESPIGLIEITSAAGAVIALNFVAERRLRPAVNALLEEALRQVDQYFHKQRCRFELPLSLAGTPFQMAVWQQLIAIPYGATASYKEIARAVGRPAAVRAVGAANNRNPIGRIVPCHRVIGADGSLIGYGGGLWRKEWLLKHEGAMRSSS